MEIKEVKQNIVSLDSEAKIDLFCEQLKKLWKLEAIRTNQIVKIWEEEKWEQVIAPLFWVKELDSKEDFIILSIPKPEWESAIDILKKIFSN